jgi:predicted transposase YbfD/YdcC
MLVSAYIVERGLILEPFEVNAKTNEIKAIPKLMEKLAVKELFSLLMPLIPQKTCQLIIDSSNDYIVALKGNQPNLLKDVKTNFKPKSTYEQINKGHGRIEKRSTSICRNIDRVKFWPGLKTLIRVESERQIIRHNHIEVKTETRYYISDLNATAKEFNERIRGYWGGENKVHYVRDVTQGEDSSRIRTTPLPQILLLLVTLLSIYIEIKCLKISHKLKDSVHLA